MRATFNVSGERFLKFKKNRQIKNSAERSLTALGSRSLPNVLDRGAGLVVLWASVRQQPLRSVKGGLDPGSHVVLVVISQVGNQIQPVSILRAYICSFAYEPTEQFPVA